MRDLFIELNADVIAEAAASFDGHVTHGSLDALMKVIEKLCIESQRRVFRRIHEISYETHDSAECLVAIGKLYGDFVLKHGGE